MEISASYKQGLKLWARLSAVLEDDPAATAGTIFDTTGTANTPKDVCRGHPQMVVQAARSIALMHSHWEIVRAIDAIGVDRAPENTVLAYAALWSLEWGVTNISDLDPDRIMENAWQAFTRIHADMPDAGVARHGLQPVDATANIGMILRQTPVEPATLPAIARFYAELENTSGRAADTVRGYLGIALRNGLSDRLFRRIYEDMLRVYDQQPTADTTAPDIAHS